jgi:hypothetical protein
LIADWGPAACSPVEPNAWKPAVFKDWENAGEC